MNTPKPRREKPGPKKGSRQVERWWSVVPKGPYSSKAEFWNALDRLMDIMTLREKTGKAPLRRDEVADWMGRPYEDLEREMFSTSFQSMRTARAALKIHGSIVDSAPAIRRVLADFSARIDGQKFMCEKCRLQSEAPEPMEMKEKKQFLELIATVMDKFGLTKIDISQADVMEEQDTEEAIREGLEICKELFGTQPVLQRFIRACTDGGSSSSSASQTGEAGGDRQVPQGHPGDGPDAAVQAIRLRQTASDEPKEVPGDDRVEPPVEDKLDVLRLGELRSGEASESEAEDAP
jgi:hypothetical protein